MMPLTRLTAEARLATLVAGTRTFHAGAVPMSQRIDVVLISMIVLAVASLVFSLAASRAAGQTRHGVARLWLSAAIACGIGSFPVVYFATGNPMLIAIPTISAVGAAYIFVCGAITKALARRGRSLIAKTFAVAATTFPIGCFAFLLFLAGRMAQILGEAIILLPFSVLSGGQ